jgi:hypothetical protein
MFLLGHEQASGVSEPSKQISARCHTPFKQIFAGYQTPLNKVLPGIRPLKPNFYGVSYPYVQTHHLHKFLRGPVPDPVHIPVLVPARFHVRVCFLAPDPVRVCVLAPDSVYVLSVSCLSKLSSSVPMEARLD